MTGHQLRGLGAQLAERDIAILHSLETYRLLDTRMVQRLHFADHATDLAAARATTRALQRLQYVGVITALERRIGGARRGSASFVWQLSSTGDRYLRSTRGQTTRRRYVEPSLGFLNHTLAVNEVAVALLEAGRGTPGFAVEQLNMEPANWRSFLGAGGEAMWLKPDLHVVTGHSDAEGEYEEHAFLEIDLGTEHTPRIQTKCRTYADYAKTGRYQAAHGLFPEVIWLAEDPQRRAAIRRAISATRGLQPDLFRVDDPRKYVAKIRGDSNQQPGGQEGGMPS